MRRVRHRKKKGKKGSSQSAKPKGKGGKAAERGSGSRLAPKPASVQPTRWDDR